MTTPDLSSDEIAAIQMTYFHWSGVATFLRCPHQPDMRDTEIGLIGFPTAAEMLSNACSILV